jgi:hypothetical protein
MLSNRYFEVVSVTPTEFRWRHVDTTPSGAEWKANGPRSADAQVLTGGIRATRLGEEGEVRFTPPFADRPDFKLVSSYFDVIEVTATHFRWRHKDTTPTSAEWSAVGLPRR